MALAFGLSVALVILLAGPLLLFNPILTGALQARHGVAADLGVSQADLDRATASLLVDLFTSGEFDTSFDEADPILDDRERSHMSDVSRLVRLLASLALVAAATVIASGLAMRREPQRLGRLLLWAAGSIGAAALALALVFAVAFEPAFLAFHAIFFPPGTYLFAPGSTLIRLFPEGFWFDATIVAGASIVLTAAVVSLLGWRLLAAGLDTRRGAGGR